MNRTLPNFQVPVTEKKESYMCTSVSIFSLTVDCVCVHPISYTQNGLLHMLDRNRRIKSRPERFQDTEEQFDVIFTVEERIYDSVLEGRALEQLHYEGVKLTQECNFYSLPPTLLECARNT